MINNFYGLIDKLDKKKKEKKEKQSMYMVFDDDWCDVISEEELKSYAKDQLLELDNFYLDGLNKNIDIETLNTNNVDDCIKILNLRFFTVKNCKY